MMATWLGFEAASPDLLPGNAVKQQLREQGVRVTLVPPREITAKANEYLALHPELIDEARERARRMGMFEKPKRRRSRVMITPDWSKRSVS